MSLKIRLARGGSKHRPYYNVVIADSRFARDGRFIEKIGSYNPLLGTTDEKRVQIDLEKAKAWLAKGDKAREAEQIERLRRLAKEADLDPDFAEKFLNFIVTEVIRHHEKLQGKG